MPFLVILKRFEVWLLLGIVAALLAFALRPEPLAEEPAGAVGPGIAGEPAGPGAPGDGGPAEKVLEQAPPFALLAVKMEESGGGWIVETRIGGGPPAGADLDPAGASVTAATGSGEPVERFFEPFRETASWRGGEDAVATLRWWLPRRAESLVLQVGEASLAVDLP